MKASATCEDRCWSGMVTSVKPQATGCRVKIRTFAHQGLRKRYSDDSAKGVPRETVDKLRKMLAFPDDMQGPEELRALPTWKAHTIPAIAKASVA